MGRREKEREAGHTSSSASRRHQATQRPSRGSIAPAGRASDSASAAPNASASHTCSGDWRTPLGHDGDAEVRVGDAMGVGVGWRSAVNGVRVM